MSDRMNREKMRKLCTTDNVHRALSEGRYLGDCITIDTALHSINVGLDAALRKFAQEDAIECTLSILKNGNITMTMNYVNSLTLSTITLTEPHEFECEFKRVFEACRNAIDHLVMRLKNAYGDLFTSAISNAIKEEIVVKFNWAEDNDNTDHQ